MSSATSSSKLLDIPKENYISSGKNYSGRLGEFSYKIKNGDSLKALTWHGKLCSDKAEIENEMDFEKSESGFEEMIKWLEEKLEQN